MPAKKTAPKAGGIRCSNQLSYPAKWAANVGGTDYFFQKLPPGILRPAGHFTTSPVRVSTLVSFTFTRLIVTLLVNTPASLAS